MHCYIILLYVHEYFCLHVYLYSRCMPGACGSQNRASDPPVLELPTSCESHYGCWELNPTLSTSNQCSDYWAISLTLYVLFFKVLFVLDWHKSSINKVLALHKHEALEFVSRTCVESPAIAYTCNLNAGARWPVQLKQSFLFSKRRSFCHKKTKVEDTSCGPLGKHSCTYICTKSCLTHTCTVRWHDMRFLPVTSLWKRMVPKMMHLVAPWLSWVI